VPVCDQLRECPVTPGYFLRALKDTSIPDCGQWGSVNRVLDANPTGRAAWSWPVSVLALSTGGRKNAYDRFSRRLRTALTSRAVCRARTGSSPATRHSSNGEQGLLHPLVRLTEQGLNSRSFANDRQRDLDAGSNRPPRSARTAAGRRVCPDPSPCRRCSGRARARAFVRQA
jgi:hypothetical protein